MEKSISFAEAFGGAGGFSAALSPEFKPIIAFDNDKRAAEVYLRNRSDINFIKKDLTQITDFKSLIPKIPDMLLAGPPCQGFSLVGMKTKKTLSIEKGYDPITDPRNLLPLEVVRIASQLRPRIIVMENVPAMSNQKVSHNGQEAPLVSILTNLLSEIGYSVTDPFFLESSKLGIAQKRKRAFLVASLTLQIRSDEILSAQNRASQEFGGRHLYHVIKDLERIPMASGGCSFPPRFQDHIGRVPNPDDLRIIQNLRPGENYTALLERMPRVIDGRNHKVYEASSFADKFYRLRWDRPSRTIVAHLQKDGNSFIHPSLDRSISVREAARIQSFPDSFRFDIPMSPAYRLIGNAVPPLMGKFLVETVSRITGLLNEKTSETSQYAGLVS
ncbi:MAG: DNA cytosine methyltransferase [Thermoplasmataceae archaeon]